MSIVDGDSYKTFICNIKPELGCLVLRALLRTVAGAHGVITKSRERTISNARDVGWCSCMRKRGLCFLI